MIKPIAAMIAAGLLMGGTASLAEAKTSFHVYLGTPYYDSQIGPDYSYYPHRGWYRHEGTLLGDRLYDDSYGPGYMYDGYPVRVRHAVSCDQARRMVRNQGFRNVVTRECNGSTYTFSARRNNHRVTVYVSARTGRVWRG